MRMIFLCISVSTIVALTSFATLSPQLAKESSKEIMQLHEQAVKHKYADDAQTRSNMVGVVRWLYEHRTSSHLLEWIEYNYQSDTIYIYEQITDFYYAICWSSRESFIMDESQDIETHESFYHPQELNAQDRFVRDSIRQIIEQWDTCYFNQLKQNRYILDGESYPSFITRIIVKRGMVRQIDVTSVPPNADWKGESEERQKQELEKEKLSNPKPFQPHRQGKSENTVVKLLFAGLFVLLLVCVHVGRKICSKHCHTHFFNQ